MSKDVKDLLFTTFLKTGEVGYHMLYSRLIEDEKENEGT